MKKIFPLLVIITPMLTASPAYSQESLMELRNFIARGNSGISDQNINVYEVQKKNAGLAALYSLLLPGMGELYAGDYSSGKYLTVADAAFWGAFAGFNIYGNWQEANYKSFADTYGGGIQTDGKDEKFFADIGEYLSVDEYNRAMSLTGRFDQMYDEETHYWSWEENSQRSRYRSMWTSSERSFNNIRFAVGALIINRIVSMINAIRSVAAYNKGIEQAASWNISFNINPYRNSNNYSLNFITSF